MKCGQGRVWRVGLIALFLWACLNERSGMFPLETLLPAQRTVFAAL